MKKQTLLTVAVLIAAFQLWAQTDPNNKLLTFMLKPKLNSAKAFEQKMAVFSKAHFKGETSYRILRVYGGTYDGCYIMTDSKLRSYGYYDTDAFQKSSKPFWDAFEKEIRPELEDVKMNFLSYLPEVSTTPQGAYSTKSFATERYIKVDKVNDYLELVKSLKPVYEKMGSQMVLYRYATGSTNCFVSIRRLRQGWKELDPDGSPVLKDEYIKMYSAEKWDQFVKAVGACTESISSRLQVWMQEFSNQ